MARLKCVQHMFDHQRLGVAASQMRPHRDDRQLPISQMSRAQRAYVIHQIPPTPPQHTAFLRLCGLRNIKFAQAYNGISLKRWRFSVNLLVSLRRAKAVRTALPSCP